MKATKWICENCNSDNVEFKAWVKPNENNKFVDYSGEESDDNYCQDCQKHVETHQVEIKTGAKIIGFQVVGEGDLEGEIHPDMDASFCVYNLSQARKMIELNENYWRLLTIWSGDIEEPTMMFRGNPRK
ncbi:MAG: hypothetical protein WC333_02060 [Dehalococcoidia bacterium]|jgi:hypothetical protein